MLSSLSRASALCMLLSLINGVQTTPLDLGVITEADLETRQTTNPSACALGVHMIVGPGKGAMGKNGLLQSLIQKVKSGIPNSGNAKTIKYNGSDHPVPAARAQYARYIKQYAASCPNTPIVMIGYSTGGILGMDTLCGASENIGPNTAPISSSYAKNIIAFTSYGEETWRANQTYDYMSDQTCKQNAPPPYVRQNTGACKPFASAIRSYCIFGDPECCNGSIGGPQAHLIYPSKYDDDAYNFIHTKYQVYRLSHPIPGQGGIPLLALGGVNLDQLAADNGFY